MESIWEGLGWALGIGMDPKTFGILQVSLRAFVIYLGGLAILRIGENRFLGKFTAFDIILGFVLGGILSRAINGSGPLFPTLIATTLLVSLHFLLARTAFHSRRFGQIVKGMPEVLVKDGEIIRKGMRRKSLSERDLEEALRLKASLENCEQVKEARFERNGDISIIKKKAEPKVVEISVRDGVQTVRIEIAS
jgi:uncharacterized membrane protein YcaP (DUF421 family)